MGSCQSHQQPLLPADNLVRKPTVERRKDPNELSGSILSIESLPTRDSSELLDGTHQGYQTKDDPILEESVHTIICDISVPPTRSEDTLSSYRSIYNQGYQMKDDPIPEEAVPTITCDISTLPIQSQDTLSSCGPSYKRRKSVKDYLQAEGASSNRVMAHIETPFGLRIEEVYDGVHDGEELGEGIAGVVRRITHRDTGIQRAVKRLDLGLVTSDDDLNCLLDEIKIMCCLDHPNVVCLEEVYEGENELFLTQELCGGGDLFDRLDDQSDFRYTEAGCARLIRQIISSVSYLHSKDIIHRDLKLENFLFRDKTDDSELIMIDFGLSKHFVRGEIQHETVGTPYTVAPEVILGKGYEEKCDVWGIGVITYLLLSGETPFGGASEGEDMNEVTKKILSGEVSFEGVCWDHVSEAAVDFIKRLLILDPEERPSASKLQEHPWLKSMKGNCPLGSDELVLSPKVVNGLVSFKELSSTRKFLAEIISYTLRPDQITGLHGEFEKIDVDDEGEISLSCFKEALIANSDQHPLSEAEIEAIFDGLKVRNTDLSIRWHEFIAACLSQCRIDDGNIRLAFDRLDNERKGYITLKDLKEAMDFYGSDSRYDLQSMWINNVMDYKSDKEHMTYDDFYKLLRLDRDKERTGPGQLPRIPPTPPRNGRANTSLARSFINGPDAFVEVDKSTLEWLTSPLDDPPSENPGRRARSSGCRRHSLGPVRNLDMSKILLDDQEPSLIFDIKASRDIHKFILEASKRVEEEKRGSKKISKTGGLFLRREPQENSPTDRAHWLQC